MYTLIFATNNQHKVEELNLIIGDRYKIKSLKDAGIKIDIPEPYDTLEANASIKSKTIYNLINSDCFSEDTGLEVEALNGEPGVKSARYAGEEKSFTANTDKLLFKLAGVQNRRAKFRTVISLTIGGFEHFFEGICNGTITEGPQGNKGFGYDPIFKPDGSIQTFGEMSMEEKTIYSHRAKAIYQLSSFLSQHWKKSSL
jgi:XTP/dITP diphosphohydrolase